MVTVDINKTANIKKKTIIFINGNSKKHHCRLELKM